MWSHIKEELWGQVGLTRPGEGPEPLVLLQHFRGNLDNWDPALIDTLASTRRVVTFDNAGVGGSTGTDSYRLRTAQARHQATRT